MQYVQAFFTHKEAESGFKEEVMHTSLFRLWSQELKYV